MKTEEVKQVVKSRYGAFAEAGGQKKACCAATAPARASFAAGHGLYAGAELSSLPERARSLSRGCGNPTGFAGVEAGEAVVDLGCGGGIDVILAARKVGAEGRVTGVDFTPQMIARAKESVAEAALTDRAIRLEVADLADTRLADAAADVVISNCVINLCPDKEAVYREAFRILRPGGRVAISDIVLAEPIEPRLMERFQSQWNGCLGGAVPEDEYLEIVRRAGFAEPEVVARHLLAHGELEHMSCCPGEAFAPAPAKEDLAAVEAKVLSLKFVAVKPAT